MTAACPCPWGPWCSVLLLPLVLHQCQDAALKTGGGVLAGTQSWKELVRYPRQRDGHGAGDPLGNGRCTTSPAPSFPTHTSGLTQLKTAVPAPQPGVPLPLGSLVPSPTFFFLLFFLACSSHSVMLLFSLSLCSPPPSELSVQLSLPPRLYTLTLCTVNSSDGVFNCFFFYSPSFGRSLSMMQEE